MTGAIRLLCLACVLVLGTTSEVVAGDRTHAARQYYSGWNRNSQRSFYYRSYYYQPSTSYFGYRHHYAIYYPSRPEYLYFYNPYKKVFWGRCPAHGDGKGQYSLLAQEDRKGSLKQIRESAFPEPGAMPPIPESTDEAVMEMPPDDLPGEGTPPGM
jgi:hypothetical protein